MKKVLLLLALVAAPVLAASAQRYAVICKTVCTLPDDITGTLIQHPAGFVVNVITWDGVSRYDPGVAYELRRSDTLNIGDITTPE